MWRVISMPNSHTNQQKYVNLWLLFQEHMTNTECRLATLDQTWLCQYRQHLRHMMNPPVPIAGMTPTHIRTCTQIASLHLDYGNTHFHTPTIRARAIRGTAKPTRSLRSNSTVRASAPPSYELVRQLETPWLRVSIRLPWISRRSDLTCQSHVYNIMCSYSIYTAKWRLCSKNSNGMLMT